MSTDGPSMSAREAAVDKGRVAFRSQRHRHAIAHFSKAINSCLCHNSQHGTREKCSCKNYDDGVKRGGAYDLVDEIMKPCTCEAPGRLFSRCDDPVHSQALGYRAGCYEVLNKLDLARRDAEWALELYPHRIEAYLRFGKVARKQGKTVLAWQIYSAGVKIARRDGLAGDAMFQTLLHLRSGLNRKLCRLDPLGLPFDIIEQIFSYFDTEELCACLRVSKRWFKALTSTPYLWRHVALYPRARTVPGLNSVRRIVKYSGNNIKSLFVKNTNKFNMEAKFPALLTGSRHMKTLQLHGAPVNCGDGLSRASWPLSNLTHLTINSHMFSEGSAPGPSDTNRLLTDVLTRNAEHIEFISVVSDHINFGPSWPRMEKLKHLRLVENPKRNLPNTWRHRQAVSLPLLWAKAPNIEHLWLDAYQITDDQSETGTSKARFPHLKSLVVGPRVYWPCVGAPVEDIVALYRTGGVGYMNAGLQPLGGDEEIFHLGNQSEPDDPFPTGVLAKVQHMYLPRFSPDSVYDSPSKACIRQGVEAAVQAGTLRKLAISVYMATHYDNYMSSFGWLRGCPSVHTLSLFIRAEAENRQADELVQAGVRATRRTDERAVAEFVRSFSNLETLEVLCSEPDVPVLGVVVEASIGDASPIKRVYQDWINGYPFDKLRDYLGEKSVELLHGPMPGPEFPVRVE